MPSLSNGFKIIEPSICHINANENKAFKYELEFCATRVEDMDLKAIFLGKVLDEFTDVYTELQTHIKTY